MIRLMARQSWLAMAFLLTACSDPAAPKPPTPMSAEAGRRLTEFASPKSWEDLEPERPGHRLRDPRTGMVFVRVPAGEFEMGDDATAVERPRHRVVLSRDYLLAETELTVGQWRRYVSEYAGDPNVPILDQRDDMPMSLSFADAIALARTLSYRLPTEAEWERACCGGLAREAEPWNSEQGMRQVAWFHRNANFMGHPVRQKAPNPYGLYDMLGNLWEWCVDDYDPVAYQKRVAPVTDPRGSTAGAHRVIRGGSWFSVPPATPRTRLSAQVGERTPFFGVRFACDVP